MNQTEELKRKLLEQEKKINMLKKQVRIDALTGLYNKKAFDENLSTLLNHTQREKLKICVFYLDIDYFKKINDTYGHLEGDKVLKNMGKILKNNIRVEERGYRIGGEEFAVIFMGNTTNWDPKTAVKRIQKAITKELAKNRIKEPITISGGVSEFTSKKETIDVKKEREKLKSKADKALYQSKQNGRKQVTFQDNTKSILNVAT